MARHYLLPSAAYRSSRQPGDHPLCHSTSAYPSIRRICLHHKLLENVWTHENKIFRARKVTSHSTDHRTLSGLSYHVRGSVAEVLGVA